MSKIEANVSGVQGITARVVGDGIVATVSGVGPQGPSGTGTWEQIEGKPTEFPPSEHPHVIGDVTGLQSALDSKQAAGSYVLTTDASVTNAREWSAATVSKIDAETGTSTDRKAFSPLRVFQAIAAWWAGSAAKAKLDGIATGATANATDAQLRDRATHTGYQTAATISDFTTAVIAAAPPTTNASLLTSGTLPDARLSSNIARTSDVTAAVAAVIDAAPASLDTLNELAAALGNDASFATTVTNSLAGKANVSHTHTVSAITDAGTAATRNVPASGNAGSTEVVLGSDTRLADQRVPTAHNQAWTTITSTPTTLAGYGITDAAALSHTHSVTDVSGAVATTDTRLSDQRHPLSLSQGNTANYAAPSPFPVGQSGGPSSYGTYGQSGGVWEWLTATGGVVRRGGSWGNTASNIDRLSSSVRVIYSSYDPVTSTTPFQGFRVASPSNPSNYANFVSVGDAGNIADTSGYGAVAYTYRINRFKVTNADYAEFLNAVAATDANAVYSDSMATDAAGGITRSGTPGAYTYAVKSGFSSLPVNFVSWLSAARYCNWLHNGKPAGLQGAGTTEGGAYTLNGINIVSPNVGATYRLPTEDEWYKAAYYKGGGTSAGYWLYATQSNTAPDTALAPVAKSGAYADLSGKPTTDSISEGTTNLYHTAARASAAAPVQSVAGRTGAVTIAVADVSGAVASTDSRLADQRAPTDGSVTDAKIATAGLSASSINWVAITPWAENTSYAKGDLVSFSGIAYRRSAAGTSGATFNIANWQQITPSEFVGSQITSGTIAAARLGGGATATNFLRGDSTFADPVTYATAAQARTANSTAAITVSSAIQVIESIRLFDTFSFATTAANGGANSNGAGVNFSNMTTGATANGSIMLRGATTLPHFAAGRGASRILWGRPLRIATRFSRGSASTNGLLRVQYGKGGFVTTLGQASSRMIGYEVRGSRLWLICHSGTAISQVDSGVDVALADSEIQTFEVVVTSDGAGNVALLVNGSQVATSSGGPSTDLAFTAANVVVELTNGGDAAQNNYHFGRYINIFGSW